MRVGGYKSDYRVTAMIVDNDGRQTRVKLLSKEFNYLVIRNHVL